MNREETLAHQAQRKDVLNSTRKPALFYFFSWNSMEFHSLLNDILYLIIYIIQWQ